MTQSGEAGAMWRPDPAERALFQERAGTCYANAAGRAARALAASYDRALAPTGLRVGQFSLLHALALHGPLPVAELADLMALDRTTLSRNTKPLVRDGLLVVEAAEHDRRVHRVGLSSLGARRLRSAVPLWERAQADFAASFGPDRAQALRTDLGEVAQAHRAGPQTDPAET